MPTLHAEYITILKAFARLVSKRIWEPASILFLGAILSPAERTVTAVLRVMGLSGEKHFQNYHRVLNRAVWFYSGKPPVPIRWVIVRDPKQLFKTQALLCTDVNISAEQIIEWFVRRWQVEVTFHEARTHLGVENQRQWADLSILRSTPALLGLFSIVTLLANVHAQKQNLPIQQAAWYSKTLPTFSDALRLVKQTLFAQRYFRTSKFGSEIRKSSPARSSYHFSRSTRVFWQLSFG